MYPNVWLCIVPSPMSEASSKLEVVIVSCFLPSSTNKLPDVKGFCEFCIGYYR